QVFVIDAWVGIEQSEKLAPKFKVRNTNEGTLVFLLGKYTLTNTFLVFGSRFFSLTGFARVLHPWLVPSSPAFFFCLRCFWRRRLVGDSFFCEDLGPHEFDPWGPSSSLVGNPKDSGENSLSIKSLEYIIASSNAWFRLSLNHTSEIPTFVCKSL